jgi:hypothetical protein
MKAEAGEKNNFLFFSQSNPKDGNRERERNRERGLLKKRGRWKI